MSIIETLQNQTRLITVAFLSETTGIPAKTLYKCVKAGNLPVYRIGGSIWIEPSEVVEWLRSRGTK